MKEEEKLLQSAKEKMLDALHIWAITYKVVGSPSETPRFSQILRSDFGENEDRPFYLKSTVSGIKYKLDLTPDEYKVVLDKQQRLDYELWDWWKIARTEYLIKHHPTINPY